MQRKRLLKIICTLLLIIIICSNLGASTNGGYIYANEDINLELYALSACLIDGDTSRVLYEKDAYTPRPMASTTKILTCILALEHGNLMDMVKISKYAASMPKVKLYAKENEYYRLKDLLYALMLESHNDVAVAIAEHISGSVEGFSVLMNEKAKEIGCQNSYFITPNGLDATEDINGISKEHSTTAYDLCKIMAYCIENEMFIDITNTREYKFSNYMLSDNEFICGDRNHTVNNANSFLDMLDGVISGKTGFTNKAGYCYVAALNKDGKNLIVSLLACGWPNNKTYKWSDCMKLFEYGLNTYELKSINDMQINPPKIYILGGISDGKRGKIISETSIIDYDIVMLVSNQDKIAYEIKIYEDLSPPLSKGSVVGEVVFFLNGEQVGKEEICIKRDVDLYSFKWCLMTVFKRYFLEE